jgi:carboxyl-terminal processing protease
MIARRFAWVAGLAIAWCVFGTICGATGLAEATETGPTLTEKQRASNVESFEVAWATVRDKHWDATLEGLDWQAVHDEIRPRVEQARTQSEFHDAMNSMIDRFGQSHFSVVPKRVYDEMCEPPGKGPRDGTTGIDVRVIEGEILVTRVEAGTSASIAGVKPGWKIIRIDGEKPAGVLSEVEETFRGKAFLELVRHRVVARRLAGKVGATKRIEFRDGSDQEVTLRLELTPQKGTKFRLGIFPSFYVWLESERLEGDVGYIAFNGFLDPVHVMPAFEKAVKSFMDCKGLVIDIRGNGGGMPPVAMGMAGWLIDREDQYLGTMRLRDNELRFVVNPRLETFAGPVAVLIDGSSASCAEIFAGGMRDMDRARLFGTRTAGAVLPAHFMKLPNGDFFYYPIADYFSQSGARLEGIGVRPDVRAPHDRAALLEGRDVAMEKAVEWIRSR